jgi:biopolymer transport protein ExbD
MKLRRRNTLRPARIEMVPLIDIVFLLLIFFIYAMLSMAVHRGMNLDLPDSVALGPSQEMSLSVSVDIQDGITQTYLNREQISLADLEMKLRQMVLDGGEKPEVLLFADQEVSYQQLFSVLDRIRVAGISAISLQADQKRE